MPPNVSNATWEIERYSKYLNSLAVFRIPSTFSPTDIPNPRTRYQIPDSVRIRAQDHEERACYYRPGEVCFYESAFEHGLRFPMDDHVRELLVNMDLTPAQVSPNMWSCLIGSVLIIRAISVRSHNITIEEFITLF